MESRDDQRRGGGNPAPATTCIILSRSGAGYLGSYLFPLFLLLAWPLGKRWIVAMLVGVALLSLGVAHWGAYNKPAATFYLLPTRGWEILLGCFVAINFQRILLLASEHHFQVFTRSFQR